MKHTYEEFRFKDTYGRFPSARELAQVRSYQVSKNRLVDVKLINADKLIAVPLDNAMA